MSEQTSGDPEKGVPPPPPPPKKKRTREKIPNRYLWRRFKASTITNQSSIVFGIIVTIATVGNLAVSTIQFRTAKQNAIDSGRQAQHLIDAADRINDAADRFSKSSADISLGVNSAVDKLGAQADATKSAAETSKDALHISERAYLQTTGEVLDVPNKRIKFIIVNTGHIPPGHLTGTIHESTLDISDIQHSRVIEMHWTEDQSESLVSGGTAVNVNVPKFDEVATKAGRQQVIVTGKITYNDGFPNTKAKEWPFCVSTGLRGTEVKNIVLFPCDSTTELPIAVRMDKYPDPRYRSKT
ncbi:hypothetical protein [Tunturiibacter psychrotolerans]|uniref:hypothetical protein n=1 Tax=Tunturiibacter psychrotolerans TaxID=3069686 RepID=UPI003D1EF841